MGNSISFFYENSEAHQKIKNRIKWSAGILVFLCTIRFLCSDSALMVYNTSIKISSVTQIIDILIGVVVGFFVNSLFYMHATLQDKKEQDEHAAELLGIIARTYLGIRKVRKLMLTSPCLYEDSFVMSDKYKNTSGITDTRECHKRCGFNRGDRCFALSELKVFTDAIRKRLETGFSLSSNIKIVLANIFHNCIVETIMYYNYIDDGLWVMTESQALNAHRYFLLQGRGHVEGRITYPTDMPMFSDGDQVRAAYMRAYKIEKEYLKRVKTKALE